MRQRPDPVGTRTGRFRRLIGTRSGQLAVVVVAVGLVGAGGWFAGSRMQSPADAAAAHRPPEAGPVTVAVERRSLTASVVAQGTVEFASPQSVVLAGLVGSPDSGSADPGAGDSVAQRITKAPAAGAEVREGDVLMQVSGRPVLVLRGTVPMYRTLGPGASGDDVRQLQRALARLGFDPGSANGTYGQSDAAAVSRWYRSKGYRAMEPTVADKQQLATLEAAVTSAQQALLAAQDPGDGSGGTGDTEKTGTTGETGTGGTEKTGATGETGTGGTKGSGSGSGDAPSTGGDLAKLQLKSSRQQLDAANAALSAFHAGYGTKVPAGEVVFLPELPARLDKVSVKPGDTPSGPVVTVTSSQVVVRAVVPADDARLLHTGMRARVETTDGTGVDGEVVALGGDVPKDDPAGTDDQQGTSDGGSGDSSAPVPVQISVPAGKLTRSAAESAKVTIEVGSSDGKVLTVPVAALHTSADKKARVQVVRGGKTVDVPVEAGLSADGQVEVTASSGAALAPGDQVVVGR
ncbi:MULTISPECIES: peptidoglycan-binding domain-containing protein [Streptomyces]|uniref:Peptidoglycan-binding domain-containing protein n=2 Tax=Streptomyces TaxID=1883 RepID=A0ABU2RGN9_9ACTN|nr:MULTISPECIES: peptidoglycan-binding domain-containing protein [unclassified Streptomyces]MDT0427761.1 peptidoglycan-binding domain-containing protein [Streptomyces sp. DSM 41770]